MTISPILTTQQGMAYAIASHGVLKRAAARSKCPVALLQTLLALESMDSSCTYSSARTKQLQQVMQLSLPLLRGYVRELEQRGYLVRESFFRRGPRLLKLTPAGRGLLSGMKGNMREAAEKVLEWQLHSV
jgi:DNA-binding MarR family transcriptional regulator